MAFDNCFRHFESCSTPSITAKCGLFVPVLHVCNRDGMLNGRFLKVHEKYFCCVDSDSLRCSPLSRNAPAWCGELVDDPEEFLSAGILHGFRIVPEHRKVTPAVGKNYSSALCISAKPFLDKVFLEAGQITSLPNFSSELLPHSCSLCWSGCKKKL